MRIGLVFSLTGPRSDVGSTIADGALLAVSEINTAGGVLGEPLEVEVFDTCSEVSRAPLGVRTLVQDRQVDALVGGYMSACRVAMLPVLRELDTVLMYPTYFEGGENDPHVFYCGAAPNQFLPDYLSWIATHLGHRIYIIGSDYIYPRVLSEEIRRTAATWNIKVVGDSFAPLGETDFRDAVAEITERTDSSRPDVVVCNLVGSESTSAFYQQLHDSGCGLPVAATVTTGVDLRAMKRTSGDGHYMVASYLAGVVSPNNITYRSALHQFRGPVPAHAAQVSAYNAVHMLSLAADRAGDTSTEALASALTHVTFNGNPTGTPFRFQADHYSIHPAIIGESDGHDYRIIAEFPPTPAEPWWGMSRSVNAR